MDNLDSEDVANAPSIQDTATSKRPEALGDMPITPKVAPPQKHKSETHCACKPDQTPTWKFVLEIGAFCLGLTFAWIYYGQWTVMNKQLALTKQAFESTEAAVLQPSVSIQNVGKGPFLQVDIINSGHIAATNVSGEIGVANHPPIRLTNVVISSHSASPEYQSGFITRTIELPAHTDLETLGKQHMRVNVELRYWNGLEFVPSKFCYGLTVSPYNNTQEWQECENQEAFQQELR